MFIILSAGVCLNICVFTICVQVSAEARFPGTGIIGRL